MITGADIQAAIDRQSTAGVYSSMDDLCQQLGIDKENCLQWAGKRSSIYGPSEFIGAVSLGIEIERRRQEESA